MTNSAPSSERNPNEVKYKNWYQTNGKRTVSRIVRGALGMHAASTAHTSLPENRGLEFTIERVKNEDDDEKVREERFVLELNEAQVKRLHLMIEHAWFDQTLCKYLDTPYPGYVKVGPAPVYHHDASLCTECKTRQEERKARWGEYEAVVKENDKRYAEQSLED